MKLMLIWEWIRKAFAVFFPVTLFLLFPHLSHIKTVKLTIFFEHGFFFYIWLTHCITDFYSVCINIYFFVCLFLSFHWYCVPISNFPLSNSLFSSSFFVLSLHWCLWVMNSERWPLTGSRFIHALSQPSLGWIHKSKILPAVIQPQCGLMLVVAFTEQLIQHFLIPPLFFSDSNEQKVLFSAHFDGCLGYKDNFNYPSVQLVTAFKLKAIFFKFFFYWF